MSQNNLEVVKNLNNSISISYWDYINGNDRILEITPDNKVIEYTAIGSGELTKEVDLIQFLRDIAYTFD